MSDKQKKFYPNPGYIVAVHQNTLAIRAVAEQLDIYPEELADCLEAAGFQMIPDPFDLSADANKLLRLQAKQEAEKIHLVKEPKNDAGSNTSTD
jgi:hypothetical protein